MAFDTLTGGNSQSNQVVDGRQIERFPDVFAAAEPMEAAFAAANPERALARLFVFPETGPALGETLAA